MPDQGQVLTTNEENEDDFGSGKGILLPLGGTINLSRLFSVKRKPVRIISFGLLDDDSITVKRIWKTTLDSGFDNCGEYSSKVQELERDFIIGCKTIELTSSIPELVIDAAGDYKIEYKGDNRSEIHVIMLEDSTSFVNNVLRGGECFCECSVTVGV